MAFTYGDLQDNPIEEELKTVCPELQSVLKDAGRRYVVFNNKVKICRQYCRCFWWWWFVVVVVMVVVAVVDWSPLSGKR